VKVHVTGGSGFTGAFVVRELLKRGHEVFALTRNERAAAKVSELGATPVEGDLDVPASLSEAFGAGGAEHLVNVASLGFGHADSIVGAAEAAGLDRAVFVSTTALFTKLDAPSKRVRGEAEARIWGSSLRWTIVRPTMIYGTPGDRNIARLLQVLAKVPVLPVPGGGHRLQQPVHVEDLATAIVGAVERDAAVGQAIDVPGPEPLSFRELLLTAGSAVGRCPKLVPVPFRPTIAALRLYERVSSSPRLKAEQLERLGEDKAFDPGPAREILGYDPRPFSDGVRDEAALLGLR
jgi:uncharacterized protein YbjT (DUF2867 family)